MGAAPLEENETQPPRQKAWRNSQRYRRDRLKEVSEMFGFVTVDQLCKALAALDAVKIEQVKGWLRGS